MAFKPITNRVPITLYTVWGLLILASVVLTVVWVIIAGDWSALWAPTFAAVGVYAAVTGLLCLMFGLGAPFICATTIAGLVAQARHSRDLAENPYATETAQPQPDARLAAAPGETVRVAWRVSSGIAVRRVVTAIVIIPLIGTFGAVVVFALLPGFRYSALNPLNLLFPLPAGQGVTTPGVFDWLALIGPFLWVAGLCVIQLAQLAPAQRYAVIADDRGVTVERGWRRRFVAWNDITAFVRFSPPGGTSAGAYVLGAANGSILVSISKMTVESFSVANQQMARVIARARAAVQYEGGADGYTASAERLLATIVARGHTPLRVATRKPALLSWMQRIRPQEFVSIGEAVNAPLAAAPLQPAASVVAASAAVGGRVILRARVPFRPTVRWMALALVGLLVLTILATAVGVATSPSIDVFTSGVTVLGVMLDPNRLFELVVGGALYLLLSPVAIVGAIASQRARVPTVIADDLGVTRSTSGRENTVTLPWASIRAWGVLYPHTTDSRSAKATFMVLSDSGKLVWVEPADAQLAGRGVTGDRRAAYREQAARLHALIVARTGLPLRDLTPTDTR